MVVAVVVFEILYHSLYSLQKFSPKLSYPKSLETDFHFQLLYVQ